MIAHNLRLSKFGPVQREETITYILMSGTIVLRFTFKLAQNTSVNLIWLSSDLIWVLIIKVAFK